MLFMIGKDQCGGLTTWQCAAGPAAEAASLANEHIAAADAPTHMGPGSTIGLLASVSTNHDPQPSNPKQVMVIMLSVELRAVDEPHRYLKSFMESRGRLQFR